ncbi:complex I intermediate-associated protein 30, mitochondrial-like [Sitodiplosis mosellana]|uniref:complex I intermediate-associated protein 30, mitochondrial-like n=1 Tax=Sitodiplosis mosellana TaxID=263140 RepID=UPI002444C49A|nr:complex I intermediate-associated protein 30, mitochondrial-like [Sitodiplosis mosellana]
MFQNFLRRSHIIKDFVKTNQICPRNFSILSPYHKSHNVLLKQKAARIPCIHPYIRRNFIGFVPDRKDGYKTQKEEPDLEHIKYGLKQFKNELKLWTEEIKDTLRADPLMICPPGEIDTVFEFGKQEDIDKFVVTSDSDHNEGYSHCSLKINQSGYGSFSGILDSTVPKQGKISRAGYCNITSLRVKKSFQRDSYYDWSPYNTLVLRIRGDGRPYSLNLHSDGIFDVTWHDTYSYILYTRGGPHWQLTKIPFSKFYLVAKGCIQDKHCYMSNIRVSRIGITAVGLNWMDGEFNLEIDYIGVENNPYHTEESSYEMYRVPNFIAGT